MTLLVVAGEPSGDRAIAAIVRARGGEAFGFGGDACARAGVDLVAHVRDLSAMGVAEVVGRAPAIAAALSRLAWEVRARRPRVALLASWSSANGRIGALLRRSGVPVAWVSPPEVWAWREGRAPRLARAADLMIPTLPFEEALWNAAGARAKYVGHPALDAPRVDRDALRARLGLRGVSIALLPGSRAAEVERLADRFVRAAAMIDVEARIVVAPGLPDRVRGALLGRSVPAIEAPEDGAPSLLPAFDAALVASGTASLEAALAGVPPVVAYAMHPLTMAIARRFVRTEHVALPNVLLQRRAFFELLQEDAVPESLARAVEATLADPSRRAACDDVRVAMASGLEGTFADRAAQLVEATRLRRW